ncbi:phosphoribosylaminoimidazolesuccinocarboxamide synthase [[Eubacterium] hominis]|uniref:phosphoribosylaminoimidazolesuccinocarboxamide synthase n=1 Tax=[Eubacterium] hominis TaxID=2764325 RepID=UPI003A4DE8C5
MKELELLYEGKAKKVFATEDQTSVIVDYKDDATAFNGEKKGTILGKGAINNKMTNFLFEKLEKQGIPTHFIKELDDRRTLVKKVDIIPLEVIVRNKVAGSFAKRMGLEEGTELACPILEFSYKNDDLNDPMINHYMALALNIASQEDIDTITDMAFNINDVLKKIFYAIDIDLIDFKLEFGRYQDKIVLADEISPDTCRFWDIHTQEHLDKDRFRRDLGDVEEAYQEVYQRLGI